MNGHFIKAVNDVHGLSRDSSADVKCCAADSSRRRARCQNEIASNCTVSSLNFETIRTNLSISCASFSPEITLSSDVLKTLLKLLLDGEKRENDKVLVWLTLQHHSQVHAACREYLGDTYRDLMLGSHKEFGRRTVLDKILLEIENVVSRGKNPVVNSRLSRNARKRRFDDYCMQQEEPVDEDEHKLRDDCSFRFFALEFVADILSHEFYAKCGDLRSEPDDDGGGGGGALRNTLVGALLLRFVEEQIQLNHDLVTRVLEIYEHCETLDRRHLDKLVELIADVCLFADCGSLSVGANIADARQYPLSQLFSQYFNKIVCDRRSTSEAVVILKKIRPEWLRLNASFNVLRRLWKSSKCFSSLNHRLRAIIKKVDDIESNVLRILNKDTFQVNASSLPSSKQIELKSQNFIFEKKLTKEICSILYHLIDSLTKTYRLKELNEMYSHNRESDEIADQIDGLNYKFFAELRNNYSEFKIIINCITKIKHCPIHVDLLRFT